MILIQVLFEVIRVFFVKCVIFYSLAVSIISKAGNVDKLAKKWIKLDLLILEYIFSKTAPKCYPSSLTANLFCKYVQHALKYTWYMIYQKKIGASETLLLTYLRGLANTKSCIPNRNSRQFKWSIWKRNFFRKSQTSVLNNKHKNGCRYIDIMT